jgi:hypothetical protein
VDSRRAHNSVMIGRRMRRASAYAAAAAACALVGPGPAPTAGGAEDAGQRGEPSDFDEACFPDAVFAQPPTPPENDWNFGTSELVFDAGEIKRFERVTLATPTRVCAMRFWGITAVNDGFGFVGCDEQPMPVLIEVWSVDGDNNPGEVLASYSLQAFGESTGDVYLSKYELRRFEINLDALPAGCVTISDAYVSVQGAGSASCWFLWLSSGEDDEGETLVKRTGQPLSLDGYDLSLCLSPTPPCDADISGDGVVDTADVDLVLAAFNQPASSAPAADVSRDGVVDVLDLNRVLSGFGPCAAPRAAAPERTPKTGVGRAD